MSSQRDVADTPIVSDREASTSIAVKKARRVKIFTVHGTFSHEAEWDNWDPAPSDLARYQQGKPRNFVNLLGHYLKSQGVIFEELDHTQYNWSGLNSHDERRTSAIGLKKLIERELKKTEEKHGKPYKEYYDGGVYVVAHSHGGTISRLAMNLWDKDQEYYGPEKRVDPSTNAIIFDELKHDDHCAHCQQERNGTVGPNTVDRPDCVITFGSPFVTFEERSGGLLAAKLTVWSFRFLTLLPLIAYYGFLLVTSSGSGAGLLGAIAKGFTDPKAGFAIFNHPTTEVAALLLIPMALFWLLASYGPKRFVLQLEQWSGPGPLVNSAALVAKLLWLAGVTTLIVYYVSYLSGSKDGVDWALAAWRSPFVSNAMAWLLPILIYWLVAISFLGRSLKGLGERVAALRRKLPQKYDPREERQAFYLNYHTPGDEPGLGLRLQGFITWLIQTLTLSMACVLTAGIVLAILAGIEALLATKVLGEHGFLGGIGLSPKAGPQQGRFISMMDILTAAPATIWNSLASIPGLASLMGGSADLTLGRLPNAKAVAPEVPFALLSAVMTMLFNLLPTILLALAVAFAVGVWLRNSMAGFGAENFAWTLASRIAISKRAGPNSMLCKINISRDAWWNRDLAHCYYYKSDIVTKDVANFIAHPETLRADALSGSLAHNLARSARWLVVTVFVLGIFAAAVPIAAKNSAAKIAAVPTVLTGGRESALAPGATFQDCYPGCPIMVVIPAGTFMMGSAEGEGGAGEGPRHKVTIAKAFAVSKTEVTVLEFRECKAAGACASNAGGPVRTGLPASELTWHDAVAFAKWLSSKTGKPYRLLSEAEWEYAARAGSDHAYAWGKDVGTGNANCKGCGGDWNGGSKSPVGTFKPNAFGLHDMHGNVWEWVEDRAHPNYQGAPVDGSAWIEGGDEKSRVVRGGATTSNPGELRSALRVGMAVDTRSNTVGFRVARTIEP